MRVRINLSVLLVAFALMVTGCGTDQALEEANTAVNEYNTKAEEFNDAIAAYNEAVDEIDNRNQELESAIDAAQDSINKGETPFDEDTLTALKEEMLNASDQKVASPEAITPYELLSVDDSASRSELNDLTEQANEQKEEISEYEIPETPEIPDYSDTIADLNDALLAYEDSVQGLKQVTAPSDDFVMDRLKLVDTITEIDAVTEEHDPNGMLNKQGGYIGCVYFADSQVDRSELYIEDGKDNVIDIGTQAGGAVEIFNSVEEAETRDQYIASFDGVGIVSAGSHYVVGTLVIRTSDELTATQQTDLTDKITEALIKVDH